MENPFAELKATLDRIETHLKQFPQLASPAEPVERVLNVTDAAAFLQISSSALYQNIKNIPHSKRFGRLYFFESELIDYLRDGKQKETRPTTSTGRRPSQQGQRRTA